MEQKLYKWEVALVVGVAAALLWGAVTAREQRELADQVIRIHVVANSDTPEDQSLKLEVRDAVLELARDWGEGIGSKEELEQMLTGHLGDLETAGEAVLAQHGNFQQVKARLSRLWFPTKEYEGFALPAGEYTALRLTIGEGAGQNWWCVAFPPLCVGASAQSVEEAVAAGHFTQEQGHLLTGAGEQYVLRFKSMELLGTIQRWFCKE